ncbi:MAG: hypothetical protein M3356_04815, partial [Actinomycetota bacterium]|nr:hypothetical protein [Actinomycetota bacterium]
MDVVRALAIGALLLAVIAVAGPATAQSPAATCEAPLELTRDGRAAALPLEKGVYTISLPDSALLSCDTARQRLRSFLAAGGAPLPAPWTVDRATATFTRGETGAPGRPSFTVRPQSAVADVAGGGGGSFFDDLENFAVIWLPVIFMGLIAVVLVLTLRYMPRTKPQEITPDSSDSTGWNDVAGVEEAKDELREVVE